MSYPAERVRRREPRRRSRAIRRASGVLGLFILIAFGAWSVRSYFFAPSSSNDSSNSAPILTNADQNLVALALTANAVALGQSHRVVYPYSVVPGGVQTPRDLLEASEHDRIVADHYAGFDFRHARLVQVRRAKLVYVSYRIGEKVFWTGKQMSLRVGENLITDGRITARTRCGNQVSAVPHFATSPAEPSVETLDQLIPEPAAPAVPFQSALLHPPGFGVTALPPPGGLPPGLSAPPPIGGGGCPPGSCSPSPPPSPPPVNMAEPDAPSLLGSMFLFWLGVAGTHWRQKKLKMR